MNSILRWWAFISWDDFWFIRERKLINIRVSTADSSAWITCVEIPCVDSNFFAGMINVETPTFPGSILQSGMTDQRHIVWKWTYALSCLNTVKIDSIVGSRLCDRQSLKLLLHTPSSLVGSVQRGDFCMNTPVGNVLLEFAMAQPDAIDISRINVVIWSLRMGISLNLISCFWPHLDDNHHKTVSILIHHCW